MQTLTAKLLNENLKKGWTEEDFANYLNVSVPQFNYLLNKNFTSKFVQSVIKQLRKNQKKNKKVKKLNTTEKTEEVENIPEVNKSDDIESTQGTMEITENTPVSDESINISLDELPDKESILQQELCDCENNLKSLHTQRKNLKSTLSEFQHKIKNLILEAKSLSDSVNSISAELNDLSEKIEIQNSDIRLRQENLSNIRAQIQSLKKITIYAYLNGTFEIENTDAEFSIPETWEQVCAEIVKYEVLESLTLKQIKLLSKLYAITHMLSNDNLEYELIFESEELQSCFSLLYK